MRRFLFTTALLISLSAYSQHICQKEIHNSQSRSSRIYDSITAARIPVLKLPGDYYVKSLPVSVDNSKIVFFPAILAQDGMSCQQYSGVAYTFGYEMNRLRNRNGNLPVNRYPANYTWNFMNQGDRMIGVNYFYSWDVLKQQGHPTMNDFGSDTAGMGIGWMNGYEKYFHGMSNRLKMVYSIPVNTADGILTLKHYLYDHLDGSSPGGVVCFNASSNFTTLNFLPLPAGTPEEGKDIITGFYPQATHGMTIVGYNDLIRYDLNGDGQFTNDIDIDGDGKVDVRDWEIGAFRIANSYGTWWSDVGFCYVLYRAMALYYGNELNHWDPVHGVWNHSVYVLVPDPDYNPLLTLKVKLTHNSRNQVRIRAGVASDTAVQFPDHVIGFPTFSFQGGDFPMQGLDSIPNAQTIEFGLDITPLLSNVQPGQATKFFLMVDEKDPFHTGEGMVNQFSVMDYAGGVHEISSFNTDIPILDNDLTVIDVTGSVGFNKIRILTDHLPAFTGIPGYSFQLQAQGGTQPFKWSLMESYEKKKTNSSFPVFSQQELIIEALDIPYAKVVLPFKFPFYGKEYDTIYVNAYGFIAFEPTQLPYMYLMDEDGMLRRSKVISPAFSIKNLLGSGSSGMWKDVSSNEAGFRWKLNVEGYDESQYINFAVKLYPNGNFEFIYGDLPKFNPVLTTYSGVSKGDEINYSLSTSWNSSDLANKSYLFIPVPVPNGISVSDEGLITVSSADTGYIYEIPVKATDRNNISAEKTFLLSSGLGIITELVSGNDNRLVFGEPAHLKLVVTNNSTEFYQDLQLKLEDIDTSLTISDSVVTISSLLPGAFSQIDEAFTFQLKHTLPDQFPVNFKIVTSSEKHQWKREFDFPVSAPEITVDSLSVFDGVNGLLDPGEVADLIIPVRNVGSHDAKNVTFTLSTSDTLVTILSSPTDTADLPSSRSPLKVNFTLQASRFAPESHHASINVTITDHLTFNMIVPFTLILGQSPLAIVNLTTTSVSPGAMMSALDSLKVHYEYFTSLPPNPAIYSSIFLALGTNSTGNHALTDAEGEILSHYLSGGGNLYMESYSTWYYQQKTKVHPYFRYLSDKVPAWFYPEIKGTQGSFAEELNFFYGNTLKIAMFNIIPVEPASLSFTNTDSVSKGVQVVYRGDDYKTIGSLLEFGSMIDGTPPSDKFNLMRRYLDFFDIAMPGPTVFFHSDRNVTCSGHSINFYDDSFDDVGSWQWEFPGGTPSVSSEKNPSVQYPDAGSYDVKLAVSDGIHSRTITKNKFITVNDCAGEDEKSEKSFYKIYPNPSSDKLNIDFPSTMNSSMNFTLFNFIGKPVIHQIYQPENIRKTVIMDVAKLPKGIYFLRVQTDRVNTVGKVIIQ
jgi:hypothetical protein